jgi:general L-amino acid transport system permease protein
MNNVNFLKPNKENLNLYLVLGALFFTLGIVDFCLNNFYKTNITGFLPGYISFFTPLIFGLIGLHLIRIEFSGIKIFTLFLLFFLYRNSLIIPVHKR